MVSCNSETVTEILLIVCHIEGSCELHHAPMYACTDGDEEYLVCECVLSELRPDQRRELN